MSVLDSELYELAKERAEKAHQATLDLSLEVGLLRGYIKNAIAAMEKGDNDAAFSLLRQATDKASLEEILQLQRSWRLHP